MFLQFTLSRIMRKCTFLQRPTTNKTNVRAFAKCDRNFRDRHKDIWQHCLSHNAPSETSDQTV